MQEEYNSAVARHYLAYRPPLHAVILAKCLNETDHFQAGLDIGSGTGQSAIALARYCEEVSGVEPSAAMFNQAKPHKKVSYYNVGVEDMDFPDQSFDMITFGGSLFYTKSQKLVNKLIRLSQENTRMLVYDFDVEMAAIFQKLGAQPETSDYDHQVDFTGLELGHWRKGSSFSERISLDVDVENLGHLLLSTNYGNHLFQKKYDQADPYQSLIEELQAGTNDRIFQLPVRIFCTVYQ